MEDDDFGMFEVEVDDGVSLKVKDMAVKIEDNRDLLEDFHARMVSRIDRTFELAGGPGSVSEGGYDPFRDITWAPLAAQRKRTDGTLIPAWGGTAKKRGKGLTKGKLRPSGRRISENDGLNQDTGRFRQRAATGYVHISRDRLTFGPGLIYSNAVQALRPAVFISESDAQLLEKMMLDRLFDEGMGDE